MMLAVISWHPHRVVHLGGLSLSPHGMGAWLAYVLGGMLMARRAKRWGIAREHVWNMLIRAVFGGIIGARLFYVLGHIRTYFPTFALHDVQHGLFLVLKIWEGGVVFYGSVFAGIVAAIPYMRKHNLAFWHVMDAAAPGFALGMIFGRIGDLIVGDHLGGASTLPFAFHFTSTDVAFPNPNPACFIQACHQTALYDLWNVIVLLPVVLWLARKRRPDGFLIMFTATWYGGVRLFVDFARDSAKYGGLRGTQWISLVLLVGGAGYLARLARNGGPRDVAPVVHETASAEIPGVQSATPRSPPRVPPAGTG